jgi:phosphate:Na+ symporter
MGELALANLDDSLEAFTLGKTDEVFKSMNAREEAINQLEEAINHYAAKIAQGTLDETQSAELTALLSNVKDVERIGDQVDNIRELVEYMRDNNLPFSDTAHQELKAMFDYVRENVEMALKALHNNDKATAKVVLEHENNVDVMERDFRLRHIRRLNEGNCYPGSGVVYLDVLSNLERISDHAENIAESVLGIYGENNGKAVSE